MPLGVGGGSVRVQSLSLTPPHPPLRLDQEERIRRGDDLRLQMAIEESKRETAGQEEVSVALGQPGPQVTSVHTAPCSSEAPLCPGGPGSPQEQPGIGVCVLCYLEPMNWGGAKGPGAALALVPRPSGLVGVEAQPPCGPPPSPFPSCSGSVFLFRPGLGSSPLLFLFWAVLCTPGSPLYPPGSPSLSGYFSTVPWVPLLGSGVPSSFWVLFYSPPGPSLGSGVPSSYGYFSTLFSWGALSRGPLTPCSLSSCSRPSWILLMSSRPRLLLLPLIPGGPLCPWLPPSPRLPPPRTLGGDLLSLRLLILGGVQPLHRPLGTPGGLLPLQGPQLTLGGGPRPLRLEKDQHPTLGGALMVRPPACGVQPWGWGTGSCGAGGGLRDWGVGAGWEGPGPWPQVAWLRGQRGVPVPHTPPSCPRWGPS